MRRLLLLFALVLCGWPADDQAVIDWMRANAIRLATPESGHGFALDLWFEQPPDPRPPAQLRTLLS